MNNTALHGNRPRQTLVRPGTWKSEDKQFGKSPFTGMAASSPRYYVVFVGKEIGVFESWEECQARTVGFKKASYRRFNTYEEALIAFEADMDRRRRESTNHEGDDVHAHLSTTTRLRVVDGVSTRCKELVVFCVGFCLGFCVALVIFNL